eukprot:15148635-Heterocapsa_arctica.AAC.1
MSTGASEGKFVISILNEMQVQDVHLRILFGPSAARGVVAKRGPGRMKHLAIKHLWMQEAYRNVEFKVGVVGAASNWADALTKALVAPATGCSPTRSG